MADQEEERLKVLQQELKRHGLYRRRPWTRDKVVRKTVLRELNFALHPHPHERWTPPYGSIVTFGHLDPGDFAEITAMPPDQMDLARQLADGQHSFTLWNGGTFTGLATIRPEPSIDAALGRLAVGQVIVRRDAAGVVRMFSRQESIQHFNRLWTHSPSVDLAVDHVHVVAPMAPKPTLLAILELCYGVLSPAGIGATFIWALTEGFTEPGGVPLDAAKLSVVHAGDSAKLAHLLHQVDRATLVRLDGSVASTGLELNPSAAAEAVVKPHGGTRHTSAKRYSYDHPEALVVTVSADGPVTIFSDGVSVFELSWYSAGRHAAVMQRAFGRLVQDALMTSGHYAECKRCRKPTARSAATWCRPPGATTSMRSSGRCCLARSQTRSTSFFLEPT